MASTLFYFIGNSDIALNGNTRNSELKNFREKTEELLNSLKSNLEKGEVTSIKAGFKFNNIEIQLPIFYSVIDYLKNKISVIYLIYTNQISLQHPQDTVFAKDIFKIYCEQRLRNIQLKEICIEEDPHDFDKMAIFFRNKCNEMKEELKTNFENYVTLSPGIPASYLGLALNLTNYNTKFIATVRGKDLFPTIKEIKILTNLEKEKSINILKPLINSFQYAIAKEILQETNLRYLNDLDPLLDGLSLCMNDDFPTAWEKFGKLSRDLNQEFREILNFISDMLKGNELKTLFDIYYKLEIKKSTGQYVEFIAMLFNLKENITKYLFEKYTGKKLVKIGSEFREFNQFVEEHTDLKNELERNRLKWKDNPSTPVMNKIFEFIFAEKKELKEIIEKFSNLLGKEIDIEDNKVSLLSLRNLGRYAHGISGVNEDLIKKFYNTGTEGILKLVKEMLKEIACSENELEKNIYILANEFIIKKLNSEICY